VDQRDVDGKKPQKLEPIAITMKAP